MNKRRRHTVAETIRNILLIALAVLMVVIFFNLDLINKGESVFSRSAVTDLKFSGGLGAKDYTDSEISKMRSFLKKRQKILQEVKIEARPQDKYKAIKPNTDILFEVHVVMKDGFKFSTPLRRVQRKDLAQSILTKLDKDVRAYLELKKQGKKAKTMVNTM